MSLSDEWRKQVKALKKRGVDTDEAFTLDFEEQLDEYEKSLNDYNKMTAYDPEKKVEKAHRKAVAALEAVRHTIGSYRLPLKQRGRFNSAAQLSAAGYVVEFLDELDDRLKKVLKKELR